ncbi:type II-A CRISPR-associated protein Csn2 [Eggerthella sp. YY7918]|uniref:type II-A CRISPR-associated protein Csn2 n=1 Tax=Eggerthella sp. (strain YY7918) TaxID=502558 RepID=UPI00021716E0|nr:type II-A CRISPR-associated protein Csn2 [Eggerthella sp. YY7918]BAK45583.1 hypothetical protein EGYY_25750 [Eggerthella sp. YY7918]
MKLVFSGLEKPQYLEPGRVSVLEVENQRLFTRICQSIVSGEGAQAVEPYTLWNNQGKEVKPKTALLPIVNPFELPWTERELLGGLYQRYETMLLEDYEMRDKLSQLTREISSSISLLGFQLASNCEFEIEWDMRRYLKAFGFGVDFDSRDSLLDNVIKFIHLAMDVSLQRALVFVNLKTFLTKNELETLYEQVIFSQIPLLLLENRKDCYCSDYEIKRCVDQYFLET